MSNEIDLIISKRSMIDLDWNSFQLYPKDGQSIMLHITAHHIGANKNSHDFIPIKKFNPVNFDWRDYIPGLRGVTWKLSWLPLDKVKKDDKRRDRGSGQDSV